MLAVVTEGEQTTEGERLAASLGLRVFPVGASKRPLIKAWQNEAQPDGSRWRDMPGRSGWGGVLDGSGLVVIDVDLAHTDGEASWLSAWVGAGLDADPLDSTLVVRTPSGGRHGYFRLPPGVAIGRNVGAWPGVDVLAAGYVVLPGSRTGKGAYVVDSVREPVELPLAILDAIPPRAAPKAPDDPSAILRRGLLAHDDVVREALAAIPPVPTGRGRYQEWLAVLMAVKACAPDLGEAAFIEWSARGGGRDEDVRRVWLATRSDYSHVGSLARLVAPHDPVAARRIDDWISEQLDGQIGAALGGLGTPPERPAPPAPPEDTRAATDLVRRLTVALRGAERALGIGGPDNGQDVSAALVAELANRAFCVSGAKKELLWLDPVHGVRRYGWADGMRVIPDHLGAPLVSLWAAEANTRLDAAVEARALAHPEPDKSRAADRKMLHAAVADALTVWLLRVRQHNSTTESVNIWRGKGEDSVHVEGSHATISTGWHGLDVPTHPEAEGVGAEFFGRIPGGCEIVDLVAAARCAADRRQAFVWLRMPAGAGKGMLLASLSALGLVATVEQDDFERAVTGAPCGLQEDKLRSAWVVAVDEFRGLKREIKTMNDTLTFSPKYGKQTTVPVYTKMFLSAEDNNALTGAGVEDQFADRFSVLRAECGRLDDTPLMRRIGKTAYREALTAFIGAYLAKRVAEYVAPGREAGEAKANADVTAFWEKHRIGDQVRTMADSMEDMCRDFIDWCIGTARRGEHPGVFTVHDYEVFNERRVVLTRPVHAFNLWLGGAGHDRAFRASVAYKRATMLERVTHPGCLGQHKVGGVKVRGLRVATDMLD